VATSAAQNRLRLKKAYKYSSYDEVGSVGLLSILFSVGEVIDRFVPSNRTSLSLVSESDLDVIARKHSLKCNYCQEKHDKVTAIAIKNGEYLASCSNECYGKLVMELSE